MQFQRRPNSDRSPESLEARLRALPQPPIPGESGGPDSGGYSGQAVKQRRCHDRCEQHRGGGV